MRPVKRIFVLLVLFAAAGCGGGGNDPAPDKPPFITAFTLDTTAAYTGVNINFHIDAGDDLGLDSAVVDYGDFTRNLLTLRGRKHLSATLASYYSVPGPYHIVLRVYDTARQVATSEADVVITVRPP